MQRFVAIVAVLVFTGCAAHLPPAQPSYVKPIPGTVPLWYPTAQQRDAAIYAAETTATIAVYPVDLGPAACATRSGPYGKVRAADFQAGTIGQYEHIRVSRENDAPFPTIGSSPLDGEMLDIITDDSQYGAICGSDKIVYTKVPQNDAP